MARAILLAGLTAALALAQAAPAWAGFRGGGGGGFHGGFGGARGGLGGAEGGARSFDNFQGNGSWGRTAAGGVTHTSDTGGFEHGTAVGPEGVAHAGDAGGYAHGSAADASGAAHVSDSGGYVHGSTEHGGYYSGGYYGGYYGHPTTVNYYGAGGCWNCWGGGYYPYGAAATGVAIGAAAASADTTSAYEAGVAAGSTATYAALPAGCTSVQRAGYPYYYCTGGPAPVWLAPVYGAHGVYYQVVAAPA